MCNELECAIQSAVDLININITRDVQEECCACKHKGLGPVRVWMHVYSRYHTHTHTHTLTHTHTHTHTSMHTNYCEYYTYFILP